MAYQLSDMFAYGWDVGLKRRLDQIGETRYTVEEFETGKRHSDFGPLDYDKPEKPALINMRRASFIPEHLRWRIPQKLFHVAKQRREVLPDWLANDVVSQKFKDVVERLDPGVHQFFEVEIVFAKIGGRSYGAKEGGPFYFWNVQRGASMLELFDEAALRGNKEIVETTDLQMKFQFDGVDLIADRVTKTQGLIEDAFYYQDGRLIRHMISSGLGPGWQDCKSLVKRNAFGGCNALRMIPTVSADRLTLSVTLNDCIITNDLHDAMLKSGLKGLKFDRQFEDV
jgi:hypothetical protein